MVQSRKNSQREHAGVVQNDAATFIVFRDPEAMWVPWETRIGRRSKKAIGETNPFQILFVKGKRKKKE